MVQGNLEARDHQPGHSVQASQAQTAKGARMAASGLVQQRVKSIERMRLEKTAALRQLRGATQSKRQERYLRADGVKKLA